MKNKQLGFRDERKDVAARKQFIKKNLHPISLILDGLSNQRNFASIFRIAEAARVKKIIGYKLPLFFIAVLSGHNTARPRDDPGHRE
ncbi:MAG: hypothetical protein AAF570_09120, partial [Bacteroidota bacterium]